MKKISVHVYFENEICNIGSKVDGESLYDLIWFDDHLDDARQIFVNTVPRVGETIELRSNIGLHYFNVLAIHNSIHTHYKPPHSVKILLKQMELSESNNAWFC